MFDRPDLLSVDNSYITITNAEYFNDADLEVLKHMIIIPDETEGSSEASFEVGDEFYAEGELTQVSTSIGSRR